MGRFGLIPSDVLTLHDGTPVLGFFRFDRGAEPADHHSIALIMGPEARLLHVATETLDIEAVGQGQHFLRREVGPTTGASAAISWEVRSSSYWKDPVGDEWEHYADGDLMTADSPTGHQVFDRGGLWTWGDDLPIRSSQSDGPDRRSPARESDSRGAFQTAASLAPLSTANANEEKLPWHR